MEKVLYVTDLDGTLMKNDKSVSETTVAILNELLAKGMLVTYATARSISSAFRITRDIQFRMPAVTWNGTVLADPRTGEELEISSFAQEEVQAVRQAMQGLELCGFVTSHIAGQAWKSYLAGRMNEGFEAYLDDHLYDKRLRQVRFEEELFEGETCYFTFIGQKQELDPFYERIRQSGNWTCIYQRDTYRQEYWLEICPKEATKAKAVRKLQRRYQCERLVVFGDSLNDISMFQAADEAYAVENAMPEVKEQATGIILSNEEDGVAKWLREEYCRLTGGSQQGLARSLR